MGSSRAPELELISHLVHETPIAMLSLSDKRTQTHIYPFPSTRNTRQSNIEYRTSKTGMIYPAAASARRRAVELSLAAAPPAARGLHWFTLELSLSNSRTHSGLSWVTRWIEELKLS